MAKAAEIAQGAEEKEAALDQAAKSPRIQAIRETSTSMLLVDSDVDYSARH